MSTQLSTAPVTVVIPSLANFELLERNLPSLFREFGRREVGDELVIVDDSGSGGLEAWAKKALRGMPAKLEVRESNGGFAPALTSGIMAASHPLIFSMNSDVRVRPGFLDPLIDALGPTAKAGGPNPVFAAAPRVLLNGEVQQIESFSKCILLDGLLTTRLSAAHGQRVEAPNTPAMIPFAIGGTVLFRRADFEALGGFDELFAPFYFEDNDLCWRAWRGGSASVFVPDSVVEHHHKGTIGSLLSAERRRAAIERGELLFNWKHLDQVDLPRHMAHLYRRALDAWVTDDRDALIWLQLALDSMKEACSRRSIKYERSTTDVLKDLDS
ncbi:MAG: GT2 family glycosyltransferase [Bacteroidia bacterium]|jgi:GT2 family glycosyltransferase